MNAELNDRQRDEIYRHFEQTAGRFTGEALALFLARLNLLLLEMLADEHAARALITEAAQCSPESDQPPGENAAR
ncbi:MULTISPECIES: hypothetical protein [Serratia]|uniref:hypothetical protein n=1 Tax=Serratia TaxID=613 RepID=UPI0004E362A9|nr:MULTISPECIES: hypothetical protein [Serratia]EMB6252202.1 hypothetical protein [Serratia marcescens]KFB58157.1 hypothetical protein DH21_03545 [Serratia marcescens]MBH2853444.1 hypothetical protein [Serratia marcescens]MBN5271266.1 hypothetical protein [Serratia marcescens]MBN5277314.1 hypothetical protein [Serratia marcescens]